MDFSLTDAQQEIARLAGQLLDDGKADPWKELARSGLLALALPADLGREHSRRGLTQDQRRAGLRDELTDDGRARYLAG